MTLLDAALWWDLLPFILIGFVAQLIDGTVGMAFGIVGMALLVLLGLPPVTASVAVHMVECFTSGASGLSHAFQRNVDWRLFRRLIVPGIAGGMLGAWLLISLANEALRAMVLIYLGAMGLYLFWRGARRPQTYRTLKFVGTLGFVGGTVDGAGGGGWGPVVSASLLAQGAGPRMVIGTVNAAEFFVTVTISASLIGTIGWHGFPPAAAGLLIGGLIAAPIGAMLARRLPPRLLINAAAVILVVASSYGLLGLTFDPIPILPKF